MQPDITPFTLYILLVIFLSRIVFHIYGIKLIAVCMQARSAVVSLHVNEPEHTM